MSALCLMRAWRRAAVRQRAFGFDRPSFFFGIGLIFIWLTIGRAEGTLVRCVGVRGGRLSGESKVGDRAAVDWLIGGALTGGV